MWHKKAAAVIESIEERIEKAKDGVAQDDIIWFIIQMQLIGDNAKSAQNMNWLRGKGEQP